MRTAGIVRYVGCAVMGLSAHCSSAAPAVAPEAAALVDEPAVMAMSAGYAMLNKVNRTAFTSLAGQAPHGGDPLVDVYVNSAGVAVYRGVDPTATLPVGPFATGTLIVKYNEAAPPFLTVMYKAAPSYDSGHGDWWYGRLNTDGTSTGYTGRVSFCVDCHGARAAQDYAYGVALDNR